MQFRSHSNSFTMSEESNWRMVNTVRLIGPPFGGEKRFLHRWPKSPNRLIIISCMFQECWPTWPFKRPFCCGRRPRLVKLHHTKRDRKCREKPSKVHCGYQFQMSHCLLSGRKKVLRGGRISPPLIFIRSSLSETHSTRGAVLNAGNNRFGPVLPGTAYCICFTSATYSS